MYSANVIALGKAAFLGTETEQRISVLLYDDNFQVISSFELNQIASLTYHEGSIAGELDLTDKILENLQTIVCKPIDYSPLTMEKALVVTKHILIFGATKVIQPIRTILGRHIDTLQQYNTALLAQQQTGATGLIMRLKGGAVDKGGPVRDLAATVTRLLSNDQILLFERNTQADPNSLVPIGSRREVSFVSDEARLRYLKKKMEHEKMMEKRSNLAKANDGFGAGYMSRDGKTVVGAAHGIEEMIKQAQRENEKFTDDGRSKPPRVDIEELRQYAQEFEQQYGYSTSESPPQQVKQQQQQQQQLQQSHQQAPEVDLLSLDSCPPQPSTYSFNLLAQTSTCNTQKVDLLDFGSTETGSGASLGTAAKSNVFDADLFGSSDPYTAKAYPTAYPVVAQVSTTTDLLEGLSITSNNTQTSSYNSMTNPEVKEDPFAFAVNAQAMPQTSLTDPFSSVPSQSLGQRTKSLEQPTQSLEQSTKKAIMSTNVDRFAALDIFEQASPSITSPSSSNAFGKSSGSSISSFAGLGIVSSKNDSFAGLVDTGQLMQSNLGNKANTFGGVNMMNNANSGLTNNFYGTPMHTPFEFSNLGLSSMSPKANLSSIQVSQTHVPNIAIEDDEIASGFVMGGAIGSGLEPVGAPPNSAPPPPPPSYW